MRDRFPLVLVGGLIMLAVLGGFILKSAKRGEFADRLSTYRSGKDGSRALFLVLQSAGVPVTRHQKSFDVIDTETHFITLGTEFGTHDSEQIRSLFGDDDADAGISDDEKDDQDDIKQRGFNALRSPPLSAAESDKLLEHARNGATVIVAPWAHEQLTLLKAIDVSLIRGPKKLEIRTLVPALPTPFTVGVERVEARVRNYLEVPVGAVPLLIDADVDEVVAAMVPWGQGRIVVLGAPELAMNQALTRADNAQFWVSFARAVTADQPLAFDEYHHGFTGDRSMADFATRYGLQFAVAQLLLGAVLWAFSLKRFGRAGALIEEKRLGETDALLASSRLYREGRHYQHATQAIVKELSSHLAQRAGVSPVSTPAHIGAALELQGQKVWAAALLEISQLASAARNETEVQEVARKAALVRTQLTHKTRSFS